MTATTEPVDTAPRHFSEALIVRCECGAAGCGARFAITRRQLERVRRYRRSLVARAHVSSLDDVVGIADAYLVLVPRPEGEHTR